MVVNRLNKFCFSVLSESDFEFKIKTTKSEYWLRLLSSIVNVWAIPQRFSGSFSWISPRLLWFFVNFLNKSLIFSRRDGFSVLAYSVGFIEESSVISFSNSSASFSSKRWYESAFFWISGTFFMLSFIFLISREESFILLLLPL